MIVGSSPPHQIYYGAIINLFRCNCFVWGRLSPADELQAAQAQLHSERDAEVSYLTDMAHGLTEDTRQLQKALSQSLPGPPRPRSTEGAVGAAAGVWVAGAVRGAAGGAT